MKRLTFMVIILSAMSGCSDPCDTLSEKVCTDVGGECSVWQSTVKDQMIPLASLRAGRQKMGNAVIKQRAEDKFCRNLSAEENYASYTLPQVKYLLRVAKDPASAGPPPKLAVVTPVAGFSVLPSWLMYALAPLSVAAAGAYAFIAYRRRMAS